MLLGAVSAAWSGNGLTMLQRRQNEGMDFAAHNVTIEWLKHSGQYRRYKYFIFLNSSVKGPFYPTYMPPDWQWTRAYTDRLVGDIKVVSSSLVCLPTVDAGGFGPKLESWAFAIDQVRLQYKHRTLSMLWAFGDAVLHYIHAVMMMTLDQDVSRQTLQDRNGPMHVLV